MRKPEVQKDKKTILLVFSAITSFLAILLIVLHLIFSTKQVVYVDNLKLFDGFNMTKEMKKIGEKQFLSQKSQLDSLLLKIQKGNPAEQQALMKEYVLRKENLTKATQEYAYAESQKIWKRLESYIQDFSKEKNYSLIVGSDKRQDVLYVSEDVDITSDLINYVNSKYEGGK